MDLYNLLATLRFLFSQRYRMRNVSTMITKCCSFKKYWTNWWMRTCCNCLFICLCLWQRSNQFLRVERKPDGTSRMSFHCPIWCTTHVLSKYVGSLKIDDCEGTMVCSHDNIHWWWFTVCCMMIDFIRTHYCIPTVINFEATKPCHDLFHDPTFPNVNFKHVFYLIWWCHDNLTVRYQLYM